MKKKQSLKCEQVMKGISSVLIEEVQLIICFNWLEKIICILISINLATIFFGFEKI